MKRRLPAYSFFATAALTRTPRGAVDTSRRSMLRRALRRWRQGDLVRMANQRLGGHAESSRADGGAYRTSLELARLSPLTPDDALQECDSAPAIEAFGPLAASAAHGTGLQRRSPEAGIECARRHGPASRNQHPLQAIESESQNRLRGVSCGIEWAVTARRPATVGDTIQARGPRPPRAPRAGIAFAASDTAGPSVAAVTVCRHARCVLEDITAGSRIS